MGLSIGVSNCDCGGNCGITAQQPDPDPKIFYINNAVELGEYCVIELIYPNCTNYEGHKILVYQGTTLEKLYEADFLDPHFCKSTKHPSPIARFVPTFDGWMMAHKLVETLRQTEASK